MPGLLQSCLPIAAHVTPSVSGICKAASLSEGRPKIAAPIHRRAVDGPACEDVCQGVHDPVDTRLAILQAAT